MDRLLTAQEMARFLGVNEMTLYRYVREGKIPAIRIGKLWRFDWEQIRTLLEKGGGDLPALNGRSIADHRG